MSLNQDTVLDLILIGYQRCQIGLDLVRIGISCQAEAVRDTGDVRVDTDCGLIECMPKENVCGFPADTRKRQQILKVVRNATAIFLDESLRAILD